MTVRWLAAVVMAPLALAACGAPQLHVRTNVLANSDGPTEAPGQGFPARSGQLVLSESTGPYRLLFGLAPRTFQRFTHSGVVMVEEGEVFVYDYSGEFKAAFARTPAEGINGGLRRTPFWEYISGHLYVEVVEPPPTESGARVDHAAMVRRLTALKADPVPFDAYWDFADRQAFFCTEFVVEVVGAGGARVPGLVPLTANPSLLTFLRWFGVSTNEILPAGAFAGGARVAAFGSFATVNQVAAYFAAKAELHRRFAPGYRVGHLFYLEGKDVKVHPHIEAFLDEATHLFDVRGKTDVASEEVRAAVLALAVQRMGPSGLPRPPAPSLSD